MVPSWGSTECPDQGLVAGPPGRNARMGACDRRRAEDGSPPGCLGPFVSAKLGPTSTRSAMGPDADRTPRLGLRENLPHFALLGGVNALVGGLVGQERTVLPLLAEAEF